MGILGRKKTTKKNEAAEKKPVAAKKAVEKKAESKKDDAEKKGAPKRQLEEKDTAAYAVVREPVFTEKADRAQASGKYTFIVDGAANKVQIAAAVKALYGVVPVSVHVLNAKGKKVRFGRSEGRRKDRKKAIVTLKAGDTIAVME